MASRAGTKSASSLPFHLIKNMSSPEESVAPMIRSGSRFLSNPLGFSSSFFFFLALLSPDAPDFLENKNYYVSMTSTRKNRENTGAPNQVSVNCDLTNFSEIKVLKNQL